MNSSLSWMMIEMTRDLSLKKGDVLLVNRENQDIRVVPMSVQAELPLQAPTVRDAPSPNPRAVGGMVQYGASKTKVYAAYKESLILRLLGSMHPNQRYTSSGLLELAGIKDPRERVRSRATLEYMSVIGRLAMSTTSSGTGPGKYKRRRLWALPKEKKKNASAVAPSGGTAV